MNQPTEVITNNHATTFHDYFLCRKKLVEYKEEVEKYKMNIEKGDMKEHIDHGKTEMSPKIIEKRNTKQSPQKKVKCWLCKKEGHIESARRK